MDGSLDSDDDEIPILVNLDKNNDFNEEETKVEREETINTQNKNDLSPVPVTLLTGFLGSGKTTLVQYILRSPDHGKKIAVIENEYSGASAMSPESAQALNGIEREGLSIETLIARDGTNDSNLTDLIELPNGCLCCTVKDSLIDTLESLLSKKRELDYILIECSGMANPGPIASVFWLDDALESRIRLDGVVACVDAKNLEMQLKETSRYSHGDSTQITNEIGVQSSGTPDEPGGDEAAQQIAYADRIIVNKTDLLGKYGIDLSSVLKRVRQINSTAPIQTTTYSQILNLEWILDAKCFDVDKAKEVELAFNNMVENKTASTTTGHVRCFDEQCLTCSPSVPQPIINEMKMKGQEILCMPCSEEEKSESRQDIDHHTHTNSIGTIALVKEGSMNLKRMNAWLASILWPDQDKDDSVLQAELTELERLGKVTTPELAAKRNEVIKSGRMQIFRIKGVLSIKHDLGEESNDELISEVDHGGVDRRKYIVQAVNDLWDIHSASESLNWESTQTRFCKLVVIGRNLNRAELENGFKSCLAST